MGLPLLLLVLGVVLLVGMTLLARLRQQRMQFAESMPPAVLPVTLVENEAAVLVAEGRGQVIFINPKAKAWFNQNGSTPNLEVLVESVQPAEAFLELFGKEGQTSFRIGKRRVDATSHYVPRPNGAAQVVIVMRELDVANQFQEKLAPVQAMGVISEIAQALSAATQLDPTLSDVLKLIGDAVPYSLAEITLWDEDLQILRSRGRAGEPQYFPQSDATNGVYHLDDSYTGWLARYRQPLLIADTAQRHDVRAKANRQTLQSFVGVPMLANDRFIGTIELSNAERLAFNHEDLSLLQTISGQIAIFIENTRLVEHQANNVLEFSGLQELSSAMTSMRDARTMYQQISTRIATLVNVEVCGLLLYEEAQEALVAQESFAGIPDAIIKMYRIPMVVGTLPYNIFQTREWWYSNNVKGDDLVRQIGLLPLSEAVGVRTTALVPLLIGERRFGAVQVANKRDGSGFNETDMRTLVVFASQVAIIVESARLYAQEQRRVDELGGLQQISEAISVLRDPNDLYEKITERIARLMNVGICGVLFHDKKQQALIPKAPFFGVEPNALRFYQISYAPDSRLVQRIERRGYWLSNGFGTETAVRDGIDKIALSINLYQMLIMPLRVEDRLIGFVQIGNKTNNTEFTETDVRALSLFAQQAAIIIENAQVYRQTRVRAEEAEALRAIADIVATRADQNQLLYEIASATRTILDCDVVSVALLDNNTSQLNTRPEWVSDVDKLIVQPFSLDIYSDGFEAAPVNSKRTFLSNDVLNDERVLPVYRAIAERYRLSAILQVPIMLGDRIFGELMAASRRDHEFDQEHLRVMHSIAAQVATALERFKLVQNTDATLNQRSEQVEALTRISSEFSQNIDLERILDVIRHETMRVTKADGATIVLFQPKDEWLNADQPAIDRRVGSATMLTQIAPIERESIVTGKVIAIADYHTTRLEAMPTSARSALSAPITYNGEPLATIHVYGLKPDQFSESMQGFLKAVSNQAAIAFGSTLQQSRKLSLSDATGFTPEYVRTVSQLGLLTQNTGSLDTLLGSFAQGLSEATGFKVTLIRVANPQTKVLEVAGHTGLSEESLDQAHQISPTVAQIERYFIERYKISQSYLLPAEEESQWAVQDDLFVEVPLTISVQGLRAWNANDLVIVPLRNAAKELIGVINIDDPKDGKRPTLATIETAELYAAQCAAVVENMRAMEAIQGQVEIAQRERDRLEKLYLVATEIQRAADIPTRLKVVADAIHSTGWGRVAITLRDQKMDPLNTITVGFTDAESEQFRSNLLNGMLWSQRLSDREFRRYRLGQAYYVRYNDPWVTENKRIAGAVAPTETVDYPSDQWHPLDTVYLPLYGLDRSRLIAILTMDRPDDDNAPTEATLRPIELFAAQAASAIENTRLYDETVRQATQEQRINEIMEAVASTLDLDEIIEGIASGLRDMIAFTRMSVIIADDEQEVLVVRQVRLGMRDEISIDAATQLEREGTAIGEVIRDSKMMIFHIAEAAQQQSYSDLSAWQITGERTSLIVPMVAGGRVTGALHMGSELSGAFGFEEQMPLIGRLANLAAIAIENARLFQQTIDRERFSSAVGRIGQTVSASAMLNRDSVLGTICEETVNILDVPGAYIWLVEGDDLLLAAAHGLDADKLINRRLPLNGRSFEASVVQDRVPQNVTDINLYRNRWSNPIYTDQPIYAVLGVPLTRDERAIGALVVIHTDPQVRFGSDKVERALTFAVQASIAYESLRLYGDVENRARQLATLTEISGELTSTLNLDAASTLLMDRLALILDYDRATLWLRRGTMLMIKAMRGFDDAEGMIGLEMQVEDSPLFRELAARGKVENVPDITTDERFPKDPNNLTRSWMGVSLVSGSTLIGLLTLEKDKPFFYTSTMEQLALTFANQAAAALDNARLFAETNAQAETNTQLFQEAVARAQALDQQAKRLQLLNQISAALTQSPDTENIFDVTLREMVQILGVDRGSAVLFESGRPGGRFVFEYPRGDNPPEPSDYDNVLESSAVVEEMRRTLQPVIIREPENDPRMAALNNYLAERSVATIIYLPMVIGGQVIGSLNFEAHQMRREFTPDQIDITQTIAAQAVIAVQNANLFEQALLRTRELETLFEATQATSASLNLQEVLHNTTQQMLYSLQVESCQIMFWDDMLNQLTVEIDVDMYNSALGDAVGKTYELSVLPTHERALRSRQMILLRNTDPNISDEEKAILDQRQAQWRVLLPLAVRDQINGLIIVEARDPSRVFTASDVRLARTLASQSAVAIENARLNTATAAKVVEQFVINEISNALASAIELEQIFEIVRLRLPELIKAQVWLMAFLDEDGISINYPIAYRNGKPFEIPSHLVGDDEVSLVIKRRTAQRLAGDEIEEVLRNLKITRRVLDVQCFLGVPMISGNQVVGALFLGDEVNTRAFNLDIQRVLSTVSAQIAVAIQNARLFKESRQFASRLTLTVQERTQELQAERDRIQFLYRITTDLALSLDLEVVLNRSLDMMSEAVGADMGAILDIDSVSNNLVYRATRNISAPRDSDDLHSQHEGLAGWVIQSQQSVIVNDVQNDPRWLVLNEWDSTPRSAMAVLLESSDDIYGVVMLYSRRLNAFEDNQLRLVTAAARQVAAAMNNAQLYGLIREQAERLAMMVRREQVESTKNAAIVESIADGVLSADSAGEITGFNSAAERILGLKRRAVLGKHIRELSGLYSSASGKSWVDAMQEWTSNPNSHRQGDNFSVQIQLENGRYISVTLSPVSMADQSLGTVSVIRDITREIEVDRVKSEFVATVSHELRTPMTSIKGYADLLLLGAAGQVTDAQQKFLSTIKSNADRLSILVNELLDISRIDRGAVKLNFVPTDVREMLEHAAQHLQGRVQNEGKNITITTEIPEGIPSLRADPDRLTQILNNLADNAFNYTYAGGTVHLSAYAEPTAVVLTVKDSGIGITKEKQERIWTRFFRDEEQQIVMETAGTGLGLAIVKEYVAMHEGEIWLESAEGQGTTFFVRIPTFNA